MEHLERICEMANKELESVASNGKFKSREDIVSVGELIDMIKDIYEIEEMDGGMEDGYSNDGGSYRYDRMYSREGGRSGGSYARGRGRNARRDSMGRYSRDGGYSNDGSYRGSYRGSSYRGGYSRADEKSDYIESLREMMEDAPDDQTRQSIQRMIQQMENQ